MKDEWQALHTPTHKKKKEKKQKKKQTNKHESTFPIKKQEII